MRNRIVIVRSAISGVAWAGIALLLMLILEGTAYHAGRVAWQMRGGIVAAPLIGSAVGLSSAMCFHRVGRITRIFIALLTLYAAAFVFNLAARVPTFAAGSMHPVALSNVFFDSWNMTLAGLTWTGFVLVLGPLAFANHLWVSRAAKLA